MNVVLNEKDLKVLNDFIQDLPARYQNNIVNWINTKIIENEVTIVPLPIADPKQPDLEPIRETI